MAARLFQSILLEVKNKVSFVMGIVDAQGNIVSCTELRHIGEVLPCGGEFIDSGAESGEADG